MNQKTTASQNPRTYQLIRRGLLYVGVIGIALTGISALASRNAPVSRVQNVDLQRYMGPWFIVGAIGLGLEKGAHNAVETYNLNSDGSIATVFQFREDSFDGELETKVTTAWIEENTRNAEWRVRTIWPLKQQYVISHLEADYSAAIIARDKRDYVWILARDPAMSSTQYEAYLASIKALGYDMSKFIRYPHDGRKPDGSTSKGM